MATTNGYNEEVVLAKLLGRLGWVNPTQSGYNKVDAQNQNSTSGRYYNGGGFHASCTIQNLYDCQEDARIEDAEFNSLLRRLDKEVTLSALNMVFDKPQFIESDLLFERQHNYVNRTVANRGKFCGVMMKLSKGDFAVELTSATLLFDSDATVSLKLINDLFGEVKDWNVAVEANKAKVVEMGEVLNYLTQTKKGGNWYLGYNQNELGTAKAIDIQPKRNCFSVLSAMSFEAPSKDNLFSGQGISTTWNMYGLNVEFNVFRDLTNVIATNAHLLDELRGLMMAAKVIEIVLNSNRSNSTERGSKENVGRLFHELNNVTTQENHSSPGLKTRIEREIKRVRQAFQPKLKMTVVSI